MAVVVASCIASAPTSDAAAHFPTEPTAVVVASCIASAPTSDAADHFPTEPSAVVVASCIASAPTPYPGAPTGMAAVVVAPCGAAASLAPAALFEFLAAATPRYLLTPAPMPPLGKAALWLVELLLQVNET